MRASDLTPLLTPDVPDGMSYAQGTVYEFDRNTGENLISVAGALLENLPILNTGEAITLKPGHVVGLTRWKSQWFILGRITIAGSGQFASASTASASGLVNVTGLVHGTSWATKASLVFGVPHWADYVTIVANASYGIQNFSGVTTSFGARIWSVPDNLPDPPFTAGWDQDIANTWHARYEATENRDIPCTGASTITVYTESISNPALPSSGGVTLTATCTYRSIR